MTVVENTNAGTGNNGVPAAARLNMVGAQLRVGMPWLIVAVIALITVALDLVTAPDAGDGGSNPGLLIAFVSVVGVGYLQTMTQTFGFALSLGITRRNFYLGTGLVVLAECVVHAVALTLLRVVERATGGWGIGVQLFDFGFLDQDNPALQAAAFAGPLLALSFLALLVGTVFKRWGQTGMYVAGVATTLVLGGLAVLATWLMWWPAVGAFFTTTPALLLQAGYPVLIALVAGVGGYLLVRRATP